MPTKLDPYKAIIEARLAAYPELSAVRLLDEIRAAGYPGGYTRPAAGGRRAGAPCRVSALRASLGLHTPRVSPLSRADQRPVERPVRYLRSNFAYGHTFLHDADIDQQRQACLGRVASVRLHGTTRARSHDRFDREERFLLQPLAGRRYTARRRAGIADADTPVRCGPWFVVETRALTAYAQLAGGIA